MSSSGRGCIDAARMALLEHMAKLKTAIEYDSNKHDRIHEECLLYSASQKKQNPKTKAYCAEAMGRMIKKTCSK